MSTSYPLNLTQYGDCLNWRNEPKLTSLAFNFLICPNTSNGTTVRDHKFEHSIEDPSTFFIQMARFGLSITFIVIILALYNSIDVLGRTIFSVASCSLHWVVYFLLILLKSLSLIVFVPVLTFSSRYKVSDNSSINGTIHTQEKLNMAGFILITVIQTLTVIVLFSSLEHEFKFRTYEQASVEAPLSARCNSLKRWKLYITIPRVIMIFIGIISLSLFVAIEIVFSTKKSNHSCTDGHGYPVHMGVAPQSLVWVWFSSVVLMRIGVLVIGFALLLIRHESLRLTIAAKFYLITGLLLSLGEDIPNSVLTLSSYSNDHSNDHHQSLCFDSISAYDIVQLLGCLSLVPFLLFVRSQYLRIEQESKLSLVWDMQRLLQVNGRRDVRTH